jgi:transcriptional regulator with XRE-family HTH domain
MTMKKLSNKEFIRKAMQDPKFRAAYDALAPKFELLEKMLKVRAASGLTQAQIAKKMHTTISVVGRLESAGGKKQHSPSLRTLEKYAAAVGCKIKVDFIPQNNARYINNSSWSNYGNL